MYVFQVKYQESIFGFGLGPQFFVRSSHPHVTRDLSIAGPALDEQRDPKAFDALSLSQFDNSNNNSTCVCSKIFLQSYFDQRSPEAPGSAMNCISFSPLKSQT